jgi:hypothetical protein
MLPKKGKAVPAGQWGTFKTFVALDLCSSVMTRSLFAGHAVHRQGGVLFIAAEGQDEVRVRVEGIASEKVAKATPGDTLNGAKHVDPKRMPFAWAEACPRLTWDDALAKLRAMVSAAARGMRERFGLPLALIVIDTLLPAAGFKDANDTSDQRVMERRQVSLDAGVDLIDALLQLGAGEVLVPSIHRLELAAVDRRHRMGEEVQSPTQRDELPACRADCRTVVLSEVCDGLEIRPQPPG